MMYQTCLVRPWTESHEIPDFCICRQYSIVFLMSPGLPLASDWGNKRIFIVMGKLDGVFLYADLTISNTTCGSLSNKDEPIFSATAHLWGHLEKKGRVMSVRKILNLFRFNPYPQFKSMASTKGWINPAASPKSRSFFAAICITRGESEQLFWSSTAW